MGRCCSQETGNIACFLLDVKTQLFLRTDCNESLHMLNHLNEVRNLVWNAGVGGQSKILWLALPGSQQKILAKCFLPKLS